MENEVRLAAGTMVALAVATSAPVVLPYILVRDIQPPPALKPYTGRQLRVATGDAPNLAAYRMDLNHIYPVLPASVAPAKP